MPARRPHPLALAATPALPASCACALDAQAATTRYVDCSATTSGDGSRLAPWNDLATANAAPLGPGDRLLLRRGTVCAGPLAPIAEGSEQHIEAVWGRPLEPCDELGCRQALGRRHLVELA